MEFFFFYPKGNYSASFYDKIIHEWTKLNNSLPFLLNFSFSHCSKVHIQSQKKFAMSARKVDEVVRSCFVIWLSEVFRLVKVQQQQWHDGAVWLHITPKRKKPLTFLVGRSGRDNFHHWCRMFELWLKVVYDSWSLLENFCKNIGQDVW